MRGAIGLLKMVLSQPQLIPGSGLSPTLHEMLKRVQEGSRALVRPIGPGMRSGVRDDLSPIPVPFALVIVFDRQGPHVVAVVGLLQVADIGLRHCLVLWRDAEGLGCISQTGRGSRQCLKPVQEPLIIEEIGDEFTPEPYPVPKENGVLRTEVPINPNHRSEALPYRNSRTRFSCVPSVPRKQRKGRWFGLRGGGQGARRPAALLPREPVTPSFTCQRANL